MISIIKIYSYEKLIDPYRVMTNTRNQRGWCVSVFNLKHCIKLAVQNCYFFKQNMLTNEGELNAKER